jgi:hypothetical protein
MQRILLMTRRCRFSVVAALLAVLLPFFSARAQTNMIIYSNTLQNGWQNWSWNSTIKFACTSPVRPGDSDSISVSSEAYAALYLNVSATTQIDSSLFTNLTFWLNGGPSGGQVLTVDATLNSTGQGQTVNVGPLAPNTWQQFTVSLASLGVANEPDLDGFWFQNNTGNTIPTYYVADIVLVGGPPPPPAGPNPTNFIGVDAGANRHPISAMIYGTAFATSNQLSDLGFTMNRSGGNEETTYNWELNAHGKGADWYFESIADGSSTPGESADSVVANAKMGGAQPLITIPMIGWGPKLGSGRATLASFSIAKYGAQTGHDPYFADAGNGVLASDNALITWNDKTDAYTNVDTTFQMGYVRHLTNTWGVSTNGGIAYYIMDNEHSLWFSTHQDIHPVGPTMQEIFGDIVAYASMVKKVDPQALIAGPEEWGWNGYLYSGYDQQWSGQHNNYNPADYPDRGSNGGWDYMPWMLNQLHQYNITNGQRLLDYFTLHCYPQEGSVSGNAVDTATERLRNQSTRQFWDSNYVDPSWINSVIMLIPRMSNWVSTYYPGTKIGITEYNWGAEPYMNGATAQADILGIFGREGLDLATRWTIPDPTTPTYLAMKIYRNYDSQHHTFGDTSVMAGGPNPDNVAVFAAQRSADEALTLMVVNKYLAGATPLAINVTNFIGNGTAQVWQLDSNNVIAQMNGLPYRGGVLQSVVPAQSVTLFVLPASSSLRLAAGAPRADGQFQFSVSGEIGQSFILQSSAGLVPWLPISTNTLSSNSFEVLLPATNSTAMFYRGLLNGS